MHLPAREILHPAASKVALWLVDFMGNNGPLCLPVLSAQVQQTGLLELVKCRVHHNDAFLDAVCTG